MVLQTHYVTISWQADFYLPLPLEKDRLAVLSSSLYGKLSVVADGCNFIFGIQTFLAIKRKWVKCISLNVKLNGLSMKMM